MAAQGFQLTALSVQGKLRCVPILCDELFKIFVEELGYLVDAIINSGGISSLDSEGESGSLSQEDKLLLSRLLLLLNPTYQAPQVSHKDIFHGTTRL